MTKIKYFTATKKADDSLLVEICLFPPLEIATLSLRPAMTKKELIVALRDLLQALGGL